jgi:alkaline phosphatase
MDSANAAEPSSLHGAGQPRSTVAHRAPSAGGSTRRDFLKTAAVSGAGIGLLGAAPHAAAGRAARAGRARNLIFLVADGMNTGTLSLANHYHRAQSGADTAWVGLYERPEVRRSLQETSSADSIVPDSASAGSSWGIGERVNNRVINHTPDGRQPVPAWIRAREAGKATGLVTTTRITHATPASLATNVPHRDQEDAIADQYLARGIDVLLGGGSVHFDPDQRKDRRDLFTAFRKAGYAVARDRQALLGAPASASRLLGAFWQDHLPYALDRDHRESYRQRVPSLAEMMAAALQRLAREKEGFVLLVEGGRVDHAGHANDAAAILREQLAFDEAVALGRLHAEQDPDTLMIVTTDHGTGGAMLNGVGSGYTGTNAAFARISTARASFEHLLPKLLETGADCPAVLQAGLGFAPDTAFLRSLPQLLQQVRSGEQSGEWLAWHMGQLVAARTGIAFTSQRHTADLVELVAIGPGSEAIPPKIANYQLHRLIMRAIGVG